MSILIDHQNTVTRSAECFPGQHEFILPPFPPPDPAGQLQKIPEHLLIRGTLSSIVGFDHEVLACSELPLYTQTLPNCVRGKSKYQGAHSKWNREQLSGLMTQKVLDF